jgi:hypothetical protein
MVVSGSMVRILGNKAKMCLLGLPANIKTLGRVRRLEMLIRETELPQGRRRFDSCEGKRLQ